MKIKKQATEIWNGTHWGVSFEINHWVNEYDSRQCWTYYLYLHIDRIPEINNPESFWLTGEKRGSMVYYKYYDHPIISKTDFHCGATWFSKEHGFDGDQRVIKIGCDYSHYWDEGKHYDIDIVTKDAMNSIDSFLSFVPDYKYWCCGNGKLYDLKDGVLINEVFHSFEYYSNKEWFKKKYLTETAA